MNAAEERLRSRLGFRVSTEWHGGDDRETRIKYDGESCDVVGLTREVQRLWDELVRLEAQSDAANTELATPSKDNLRRADYILNHYSRSHADTIVLARHLDQHDEKIRST